MASLVVTWMFIICIPKQISMNVTQIMEAVSRCVSTYQDHECVAVIVGSFQQAVPVKVGPAYKAVINPRRACAARVTVLSLSVSLLPR